MSKITKRSLIDLDLKSEVLREDRLDVPYLLTAFKKYDASDLHLHAGRPPLYRLNGRLLPANMPELDSMKVQEILYQVIPQRLIETLEKTKQVDFTFSVPEIGRFRCHAFSVCGNLAAAFRKIPFDIPALDSLRVPPVLRDLVQKPRGLLLITGATGSGKSTTMASLLQYLNENFRYHVLTLEDPIEFLYTDQKCTFSQRELGQDFLSMREGLSGGLRQDPDVISVGEMRDHDTMRIALTAAETGHLVLSTLHTRDAKSSINRILDSFPHDQQNQIRVQLAASLVGVVSQNLINRIDVSGRVLATEVLINSPAVEQCIRTNQIDQISEHMSRSDLYYKMHTLNADLYFLIKNKVISAEEALAASNNPDDLKLKLSGVDRREGYDST